MKKKIIALILLSAGIGLTVYSYVLKYNISRNLPMDELALGIGLVLFQLGLGALILKIN